MIKFWKKGGGLYLFEDNDTSDFSFTNLALNAALGFTLNGNDEGDEILDSGHNQKQTFEKDHEIFTGVLHIHEGITIARP